MKTLSLVLASVIILCQNSCSQEFKKLKESNIDSKKLKIAASFAESFLSELKRGSYYKFQDNAIDILKNHLTEQNQKALYLQLKDSFGDYLNLAYAETWIQGNNLSQPVFRFKGNFESSKLPLEIRVVVDGSDKIAGFWIKPWSDMLN